MVDKENFGMARLSRGSLDSERCSAETDSYFSGTEMVMLRKAMTPW